MFSKYKTDWSLLAKYMAGETTEQEIIKVEAWAGQSEKNSALVKELKLHWRNMDRMNGKFNVDVAWNKLQNRIVSNDEQLLSVNHTSPEKRIKPAMLVRIAATLLLLVALGVTFTIWSHGIMKINITALPNEKGKVVLLADGTKVSLNAGATLTYPKNFGKKYRQVTLDGEAFFEVSPDKSKPFHITAGKASVKVLGTSFNVNCSEKSDKVEVYVSTGIVELSETNNQNNKVLLHPGNIGVIYKTTISASVTNNENSIAWKTGNLEFKDTPLSEATQLLTGVYKVNIIIDEPGIDTVKITGSYQNDPLDEILRVICQQNSLTLAKSNDTIYLAR